MPFLIVQNKDGVSQNINLAEDCTVIGRHPECAVVIDEAAVSRRHAQIVKQNGKYLLEDLKSRNGTYLNRRMIHEATHLLNGDQIQICDTVFTFQLEQPLATVPTAKTQEEPVGDLSNSILLEENTGSDISSIMSQLDVSSHHLEKHPIASAEAKLKALIEVTQALGKTIELEKVLPQVLDCLFELFSQADRGFIVMADGDGNLKPLAMKLRREDEESTIRISRTIVRHVLENKQAIISTDAATDERFDLSQSISDFRIRSMMCAPLFDSEGKTNGVIQLDTLSRTVGFQPEDLDVLATIALQAGISINNAKLHGVALRQQEFRRDLELANEIQHRLLPIDPPQLDNYELWDYYRPADQVGGDYFDYIQLGNHRMAILVGDVVGHGIAAALLMAKLSAEARFALASNDTAAASMNQINRAISGLNLDRFITILLALLDTNTHQMAIVNAGHMPPVLRRADGTTQALSIEQSGLPVGIAADTEYEEFRIDVQPNDIVAIYTDGINETQNAQGELFGNQEVINHLAKGDWKSAEEFGDSLIRRVRQHMEGEKQYDDICMVCVARRA